MTRRRLSGALLAVVLAIVAGSLRSAARESLPARLSDAEFWQLSVDASEPDGYFRSDTLTSNELLFQRVIPELVERSTPGGVYLGVGPEQNFTYIAALRPPLAIIFDVRRGNMLLQLMYKAIFEMAANRAEFVSLLFSKPRPAGLRIDSSVTDLFSAFAPVAGDEMLYERNLSAIKTRLTKTHRLPLSAKDLDGIEYAYHAFFARGYRIRPSPSYADLMTAADKNGKQLSYLTSETVFGVVKDLEAKNLVVPVVGDFAGPKAIRTVGAYLKAHAATVRAFYLSNVEQYLYQDGKWAAFCRNFSTLPLEPSSTFIRSTSGRGASFGVGFVNSLGSIVAEARECRQ
jgi:hypothetical protein